MTDLVVVLTTVADNGAAERMTLQLVEERLAACVNLLPPMLSFYRWEGKVERGTERQLLIKTTGDRVAALEARLRELHAYELPEFVIIPAQGSAAYAEWIVGSVHL